MLRDQIKTRIHAFGAHLLISLCLGGLSYLLVFQFWYPGLLAYASNVTTIFIMLLSVDGIVGPVITLIIYNEEKKSLKFDLLIIGILQICALLYGLHSVFIARPVYLVFNAGQFDVTYANEISEKNLKKVRNVEYQTLPWFSQKTVSVKLPDDPKLIAEIVVASISGGDDPHVQPQYYSAYKHARTAILDTAKSLNKLYDINPTMTDLLNKMVQKYKAENKDVGFIPMKAKSHNLTVIVDKKTGEILELSKLNPFS